MIHVENLSKSFGKAQVLRDASLSVAAGELALLTGANGTGKSTLLRILAGLMRPDGGAVSIEEVDVVRHRMQAQARLAYLPQAVRFHEAMTPRQVLRFYAQLRQVSLDHVEPLLEEVCLAEAGDRPCGTLSGGMRQRLGLAVTWLPEASVLLLDEPGLSLDPAWRSYLIDKLHDFAESGHTVLVATHLVELWEDVADVILHCANGTISSLAAEEPIGETSNPDMHLVA